MSISLEISFGGGLEILFGGERTQSITVPTEDPNGELVITELFNYMATEMLEQRPELFLQGDTIRPGIIVLVNDQDYQLCGGDATDLVDGDQVTFISTLHGG